jgi:hypothetical protein
MKMRQQSNVTVNVDGMNAIFAIAYMCRQYMTGLTVWGNSAMRRQRKVDGMDTIYKYLMLSVVLKLKCKEPVPL